ncbi:MAG: ATP-binding cassette domain-containing protein, partial [Candidatus Eisenbacteria bacterium]|nr:ATP-binding cassette domain-containing protein [Candidatus Eisenbacteria bacterium]
MDGPLDVSPPVAGEGAGSGSAPEAQAVLRIAGLGKRFGDFVAVEGLDLAVGRGEIFALLGPNGAGKTTTIRMLMGICLLYTSP